MARLQARRTTSRGTTPLSPPRQVLSPQSSPNTRRSTRSRSNNNGAFLSDNKGLRKQLSAVEEEGDLIQVAHRDKWFEPPPTSSEEGDSSGEAEGGEAEGREDVDIDDLSEDSDVDSAYDLEAQLSGMDRELIIDSLPALFRDASSILSLFRTDALPGIIDDIASKTTAVGRRFANFKARFDITSQPCRNDNFLVIDVLVHKLAQGPDYNQGSWRPDALLYMTNLAIFISAIITGDDKRVVSTLDLMYNNFPGAFLLGALNESKNTSHVYGTSLLDATIELAVAVRTEFFLRTAKEYIKTPAFDPDNILRQTFFDEDGKLRGFEDLTDDTIIDKAETACTERIDAIRQYFSNRSKNPIDLQSLRTRFDWKHFCALIVRWAAKRRSELDSYISAQGGPEAIVDRLITDDPSKFRQGTQEIRKKPVEVPNDGGIDKTPVAKIPPRLSLNKTSMSAKMQKLKEIKAQLEDSEEESSSEEEPEDSGVAEPEIAQSPSQGAAATNIASDDDGDGALPNEHEDEGEVAEKPQNEIIEQRLPRPTQESIVPTQDTAKILAAAKRQAIQSNKENIDTTKKFIDRQAGARRIVWNESQNKGKRPREVDDVASESDEFEDDTRVTKKPRARTRSHRQDNTTGSDELEEISALIGTQKRNKPPPSAQPSSLRPPLQQRTTKIDDRRQPASTSNAAKPSSESSQNVPPPASQAQLANTQAKVNLRRFKSMNGPRPTQIRRPWDDEEVERLIEFVALYKTSWSTMMAEDLEHLAGPKLQRRDQVGLKDKARNIKMDFMKACRPLPEGFGGVSLKASDLRKLDALNIPRLDGRGGRYIEEDEEEEEEW